mmetsp:Transcript_68788/g.165094  ORF Transcript_68788/g.165094 Transcript_68788/m.165094 type:complete len:137 (+) Transcript_68788:85-495(+)
MMCRLSSTLRLVHAAQAAARFSRLPPLASTHACGQKGLAFAPHRAGHRSFSQVANSGPEYERLIEERLIEALDAISCEVEDKSGGCGQSYAITIEAEQFRGKSRIAQQRLVQGAIRDEIAKWHAVTINVRIPPEQA